MKRQRPPMPPLAVRVQVALEQLNKAELFVIAVMIDLAPLSGARKLEAALLALGIKEPQCDHDPALVLRPYNPRIKDVAARYTPHAHDPAALVYREKQDHQQKTTGRKPGAERTVTTKGSDVGLKTKFARLDRKKKETQTRAAFAKRGQNTLQGWTDIILRPKARIAQRKNPWPKRKMQ